MSDIIDGIFHEEKQIAAGTMGTARTHDSAHALHYYCKSNDEGEVVLYLLKPDGTPTKMEMERVAIADFQTRFKPTDKSHFTVKTEDDRKKEIADKKVSVAEKHLEQNEYHAAAFEYGQAIKNDESNLEAHLGKGKAHMGLGEVDKAEETFRNLSEMDTLYEKENKHIFNEYGIELRRGKMYDLAIENYKKAIDLDQEDEALYFNIARAYFESKKITEAKESLNKALKLKPDFTEAKALLDAVSK